MLYHLPESCHSEQLYSPVISLTPTYMIKGILTILTTAKRRFMQASRR
jgi:hypothetical protein